MVYEKNNVSNSLHNCTCGGEARLIWIYLKGSANKINYYVRCEKCRNRTNNRKAMGKAVKEWNEKVAGIRIDKKFDFPGLLYKCTCGARPIVIKFFTKENSDTDLYFVMCEKCNNKTNDNEVLIRVIDEWNENHSVENIAV